MFTFLSGVYVGASTVACLVLVLLGWIRHRQRTMSEDRCADCMSMTIRQAYGRTPVYQSEEASRWVM